MSWLGPQEWSWLRFVIWGCCEGRPNSPGWNIRDRSIRWRRIQSYRTCQVSERMGLNPELPRGTHRIDTLCGPPVFFIAGAVQFAMMATAERYGEFVADFKTQSSGLGKPQVMRIGRLPAADQAGL